MRSKDYVILGAGLTGLSYGYRKLKEKNKVTIIEKEGEIGGLMRTYNFNGFSFDIGPHIFRSKNKEVMDFVKDLLKNNYLYVSSNPIIFKHNTYFDNVIPIITKKNIEKLAPDIKKKAIKELDEIRKKKKNLNQKNFKSCITSQIGETLFWEFFGDYSKKWWGIDPKELSIELAPKNLKIGEKKSYGHITTGFNKLNEEIYPIKGGIFEIIKRLSEKIKEKNGKILVNHEVIKIESKENVISKIIIKDTQKKEEKIIETTNKQIISTVPLTKLAELLNTKIDLKYRSLVCVLIKVKKEKLFEHSWIYFHDPNIIFGRVHEPKYYSKYNAPEGYTSLCAEVTCFQDDQVWNDNNIGIKVLQQLLNLGIIEEKDEPKILGIIRIPYAYPIYTIDFKEKRKKLLEKLKRYKNLKVIGRTGSFKYENMDEGIKWALSDKNE